MAGKRRERIHRFIEFFLVGVFLGLCEDLIAVKLSTGAELTPSVVIVVLGVALPFAVFSELIVDREQFDFGVIERKLSGLLGKEK